MKILQLMLILIFCAAVTTHAQEAAPSGDPVSNLDILKIAESVKLSQWAEIAKKSNFGNGSAIESGGRRGGENSFESYWTMQHLAPEELNGSSRSFSKGWTVEQKQARTLLDRPTTSSQKKWLESFIAAADALAAKDAKAFKEIVVPLAEDLRTLL